MSDERLRRFERVARTGGVSDVLAYRSALKRAGKDAPLDLSLPHSWGVVQAAEGDPQDFGSVKRLLVNVCHGDSGLHPFIGGISRPLIFKETIQARMDQLRKTGEFGCLWTSWLDSCSGIAYKANTTKFKIVPLCGQLLSLRPVRAGFLEVDYEGLPGVELDSAGGVYSDHLPDVDAVVEHEGWLVVMENDRKLLRQYAEVVFGRLNRPCMGFWLVSNPQVSQLRALCAYVLGYDCDGGRLLGSIARFARVCPL